MPIVGAHAYETSIINALAISDPQMNTALGTPIRKIITAVAQQLASYNVDVNVTGTLYSIDSVSGDELDYLVGQFGFTRHEARAARGTVTVRRDNGDSVLQFEYGSYFYKPEVAGMDSVSFQSTAYQEMAAGVLSCDIAIVATVAGSVGNVPANTITYFSGLTDYVSITNVNPTSGGRDAETDEQLRQRFLLTVFRNVSGTKDQLAGLAMAHAMVNKANLVTLESRYSETVQVTTTTGALGTSSASVSLDKWGLDVDHCLDVDRRYWVRSADTLELFAKGEYEVSSDGKSVKFIPKIEMETIGPIAQGVSYSLSHGNIVSLSVTDSVTGNEIPPISYSVDYNVGTVTSNISVGDNSTWNVLYRYNFVKNDEYVVIEFDYLSKHNRAGLKTVDLYVDSLAPQNVTDIQYLDFTKVIDNENMLDWVREDGTRPLPGHLYIPLSYQPMLSSVGHINMGVSSVLYEGTHYRMLYDSTTTFGSCRGMDAVELIGAVTDDDGDNNSSFVFTNGGSSIPPVGSDTPLAIPYLYDYPIDDIQSLIDMQRIVTMDVQVHEAKHRYFVIFLTLMFSTFPRDAVIESVRQNVINWSDALQFGPTIQLSDIETVAANTTGVDNVRIATQADSGGKLTDVVYDLTTLGGVGAYGIIEVNRDGISFKQRHDGDFRLAENEVFEVADVVVYSRSQQRWG